MGDLRTYSCCSHLYRRHACYQVDLGIADSLVYGISDLQDQVFGAMFAPDDPMKMKTAIGAMMESLPKFEKILKNNNGGEGFFVGDSMTWADLHFFQCAGTINAVDSTALPKYGPLLNALYKRVGEDPKVAAWVEKRPQTDF